MYIPKKRYHILPFFSDGCARRRHCRTFRSTEFGKSENFERWEILDWYHLKENLYKVGGSLKRLKAAETLLWQGQVEEAKALFYNCRGKQAKNFIAYLEKHCSRIVNYSYYQAEQLCSIGSGAVESAIKQIGARMKISGAQWNVGSVNQILSERLSLSEWFTCYLSVSAKSGCSQFEQLVQEYSIEDDRIFNGMMGAVSRGTMPDALRAAINLANSGELIGPLEIDELWYLVRVEKILEASLEDQLKQELKDELFEQWLEEKIQNINVKLQVDF